MERVLVLNEPTENVFCATGPGGGVDPTCPAGGSKLATALQNNPKKVVSLLRGRTPQAMGAFDKMTEGDEQAVVGALKSLAPPKVAALKKEIETEWANYISLHGRDSALSPKDVDTEMGVFTSKRLSLIDKATIAPTSNSDRTYVTNDFTENVFCATGPGGGVDPTCSSGGRRVESGESFFHGTVQEALDSIREKGLVVGAGKGADEFARQTGEFVDFQRTYGEIDGRKTSVYVSDDKYQAANYGLRAAEANKGTTPVVLRIEIPSGQILHEDEAGGSRKSFRFQGKIEPSWIKEVFTLDLDNDELISQGPLTRNTENYYLAFLVAPGQPTSNSERVLVLNEPVENVFCATGKGGGIDPTCSPKGKGISSDVPVGTKLSREEVLEHIMANNPPEQVKTGAMTKEEWADRFLSNEPDGYVVQMVHPKAMNAPTELGEPEKVDPFSKRSSKTAPPIVVDSNEKIQARHLGGKLDQAYGLQPHTVVDGKHRTAAAIVRGDTEIKAIVPVRRAAEVQKQSHRIELEEFATKYAEGKGYTTFSVRAGGGGDVELVGRTKDGYNRQLGTSDLEKVASRTGHKFQFVSNSNRTYVTNDFTENAPEE